MKPEIHIHWFRRDLRLDDNTALSEALRSGPTQCLFIFDEDILSELPRDDARVSFIHQQVEKLNDELQKWGSSLLVKHGKPEDVWNELLAEFSILSVHTNRDYEPYAVKRDQRISEILGEHSIPFKTYRDHVFYEAGEVVKADGDPYTIYTPFRKQWEKVWDSSRFEVVNHPKEAVFAESSHKIPSLEEMGFEKSTISVEPYSLEGIGHYGEDRDFPAKDVSSKLGPHLRFGTIGIRRLWQSSQSSDSTFKHQLIWRDFFIQIMVSYPHVLKGSFRPKYDRIEWRNNEDEFDKWKRGETGYPLVDAGMRELNETGYMHNRVRMVTASFLTKHLLIDWRWGEAYFAEKLLDFELAVNNGNWQWCAGTGCDAAPYFRVFNPSSQAQKFDGQREYIKTWIPELDELTYPAPMVDHKMARERALSTYKEAVK